MCVTSADFEAFRTCTLRSTHVFPTVVTVASLAAYISQNNKQAYDTFSRLASFLAIHQSSPKAVVVAEMYGRLNVVLVRSIARAILARELPPS